MNSCPSSPSRASSAPRACPSVGGWPSDSARSSSTGRSWPRSRSAPASPSRQLETYDERLPSIWQRIASALASGSPGICRCRRWSTDEPLARCRIHERLVQAHARRHRGSRRAWQRGHRRPWRRVHPGQAPGRAQRPAACARSTRASATCWRASRTRPDARHRRERLRELCQSMDAARAEYIRGIFGADWLDARNYDLVDRHRSTGGGSDGRADRNGREGRWLALTRPGVWPSPPRRQLPRGLSAFRHRNFRLFWSAMLISLIGTWMQSVAQAWLVLQLTNDPLALGLVAAAQFTPVLVLGPVRRRRSPTRSPSAPR